MKIPSLFFKHLESFEVAIPTVAHSGVMGREPATTLPAFLRNQSESHTSTSLCSEAPVPEAIHPNNFSAVVRGEMEGHNAKREIGYPGGGQKAGVFVWFPGCRMGKDIKRGLGRRAPFKFFLESGRIFR